MLVNLLIFSMLSWFFLIIPIRKEISAYKKRDFEEKYYLFQLKAVREYYESLHNLSYEEIHEKYDVRDAFQSIR